MNVVLYRNNNLSTDSVAETSIVDYVKRITHNFQYTHSVAGFECIPMDQLSQMCMQASETSLREVWDNESDDEAWSNY